MNSKAEPDASGSGWGRASLPPPLPPQQGERGSRKGKQVPLPPPKKVITDPMELLQTEVIGILNKITPQTFDKLSLKLKCLNLMNTAMLDKLIELIFEKAVQEVTFTSTYAELCRFLNTDSKWIFYTIVRDVESKEYFWIKDFVFDDNVAGPYSSSKDCLTALAPSTPSTPAAEGTESSTAVGSGALLGVLPKMKSITVPEGAEVEHLLQNNLLVKVYRDKAEYYMTYVSFSDIAEEIRSELTFVSQEDAIKDAKAKNKFRSRLVNICQNEFQNPLIIDDRQQHLVDKRANLIKQAKSSSGKDAEYLMQIQAIDDEMLKMKRRTLGNIRFVGELYKCSMLSTSVMHGCIKDLLCNSDGCWKASHDDQDIELLCRLINTVGQQLEMKSNTKQMQQFNEYFVRMKALSKDKTLNSRMRFSIDEVIELRQNRWQSRRAQEGPLKIAEIHQKIQEEEVKEHQKQQQQQQQHGRGQYGSGGGGNSVG